MNKSKKILAAALVLVLLGGGGAVYAATTSTPLEILSKTTGQSVEAITEQRQEGETLGSIAAEKGVLDQFKAQMLENRKAIIAERVTEGRLTQAEADEYIKTMEENMVNCDGTGTGTRIGQENGLGFGQGNGTGTGTGTRAGNGGGMMGRNGR